METKQFLKRMYSENLKKTINLPKKKKIYQFIDRLADLLFPVGKDIPLNLDELFNQWNALQNDFVELLKQLELNRSEQEVSERYFNMIPIIYDQLMHDAKAIFEFDPAARSLEEVIMTYPGFYAILVYRLSHQLYEMNIPILPRIFSEYAHSSTGIDIHPGARIGKSFFIDHGTGIVIGETTVIGDNVKIYQGVTLGALNVSKKEARTKRHPTIEDNVIIYSGATILGGNTVIGKDCIIGGNVWITNSIDSYSVVYHKSEIHLKQRRKMPTEQIDFII